MTGAKRGLPIAVLAATLAAFGLIVVVPVAALFADQSGEMDDSKQLLAIYQAEIASRPALEAELAAVKKREGATAGLVGGGNAALAASNIQNLVKPLVESDGGQVRSVQNLPSTPSGGFEKIGIRYDVSVPLGGLKDVAYRLETGVPYLFLDDVDIKIPESWQSEGSMSMPPDLQVRWTVQGYRWAGGP
jgi:general secretion pathway protein M